MACMLLGCVLMYATKWAYGLTANVFIASQFFLVGVGLFFIGWRSPIHIDLMTDSNGSGAFILNVGFIGKDLFFKGMGEDVHSITVEERTITDEYGTPATSAGIVWMQMNNGALLRLARCSTLEQATLLSERLSESLEIGPRKGPAPQSQYRHMDRYRELIKWMQLRT